jgi:hypothetical protein
MIARQWVVALTVRAPTLAQWANLMAERAMLRRALPPLATRMASSHCLVGGGFGFFVGQVV